MAAVKVSDIRSLVRINLEDPLKYNEVALGIGAQSTNQRVYQLPTFPIVPLSEVVTIDNVAKTRNVDYTVSNENGQLFFANPPQTGAMWVYWQYSLWSDTQLNQWVTEATRYLSVYLPKMAKIIHVIVTADVTNQGWYTDPDDLRVYKVRTFDPPQPTGSNLLWQETPYWSWDDADKFLRIDGEFLVSDKFQYLARRRWKDPDTVGDSMDPGQVNVATVDSNGAALTTWSEAWPLEFNDPVAWLAASIALEKKESPRDIQGLQGDIIDNQASPAGGFERDAQFWRKKFLDWVTFYRSMKYTQRPTRPPFTL